MVNIWDIQNNLLYLKSNKKLKKINVSNLQHSNFNNMGVIYIGIPH